MRVNPCGFATDVARRTGIYGVYPITGNETVKSKIRTWFTEYPVIGFPTCFGNSDFFEDRSIQYTPGWSSDWHDHKLAKGPPFQNLGLAPPVGLARQWAGDIRITDAPLPIGQNGLCVPCQQQVIFDETNNYNGFLVLQEDGSAIFEEDQEVFYPQYPPP